MSRQEVPAIPDTSPCCPPLVDEALTDETAATLARGFKALGDPVRLRLLSLIASRAGDEVCVCELTDAFTLTGPTISHHLKVLREAGLIDCQRRGTWVYYWIVPARLAALSQLLDVSGATATARP
ncbi:ArsR/SmtB family transcription factor [Micromonospora radicis]|uniref:Transcriptional regulator n=1 Tax=Micromonospora radicis TaxID=1894971 RepID=A0A418MZL8_9ACTN|nr:metalloregulator ArsR/SmtB family transcription factor [Micromonospora radicis]RIV40235.1 transcriptional regulator [Micromonospora radicis]